MGRILLLIVLGGLGVWAFTASANGPDARRLTTGVVEKPKRTFYQPIYVPPPPSNRTGSTRGPRVGGGGPSFGK